MTRWAKVTEESFQVVEMSPVNGSVEVGEATMAMLRGETAGLLEGKYGPEVEGWFKIVADDTGARTWMVTYPVMVELIQGLGFVELVD